MADHASGSVSRAPPQPNKPAAARRRAKVACKSCNARRVKCDVAEVQPCWHCRTRQTPCELIDSKRGKYVRKRPGQPDEFEVQKQSTGDNQVFNRSGNDFANRSANQASPPPFGPDGAGIYSSGSTSLGNGLETPGTLGSQEEGPEMLFARIAEPSLPGQSPNHVHAPRRSYYLGGSFSLAYIVKTVCSRTDGEADAVKVHYPIPPTVADRPIAAVQGPSPTADAFVTPRRDVADLLVHTFFEKIHVAFPVFDRRAFSYQYRHDEASAVALQTIYFLGATVCDESLLYEAGFSDRNTARRTCYLRAKALYDSDYEKDRVTLASVLFLLGFWWDGPEDQKDTWHWLGCAISLAQTLGMHRSTAQSGMSRRDQSLWKRIWWSIYVRDRHAAAALGRPCRIRDGDCDVKMLTDEDFDVDVGFDDNLLPAQEKYHTSYAIEMAKLSILLGEILHGEFSLRCSLPACYDRGAIRSRLEEWEAQLPLHMKRMPLGSSLGAPFWASMLQASYSNCQILLFQPKSIEPLFPSDSERDGMARMAADSVTRIAEDLLSAGTLKYGQLHLVPALFAALSIHTVMIRRTEPILRQLAENKARQCMLAMSELAKRWPVGGWILRLFINLMRRLKESNQEWVDPYATHQSNASNTLATRTDVSTQLPSPRQEPSIGNMLSGPTTPNSFDRPGSSYQQAALINVAQPRDQVPVDFYQQAASQLLSDTLWADGADNGYDLDSAIYSHNAIYPPPPPF